MQCLRLQLILLDKFIQPNQITFNPIPILILVFALIKFIQHHHTTTTNLLSSYKTCRVWFTLLECLYSCIIQLAYWIRNHYSTLNKTLPSHKYIYGYGLKLYGMYLTTTTGFSSVLRSIQRLAFQKSCSFTNFQQLILNTVWYKNYSYICKGWR